MALLRTLGWLTCVIYSTIPSFWLMVHPRARRWRARVRSPFRVLVPAWIAMWLGLAALTGPWRDIALYTKLWVWTPASILFATGFYLYSRAGAHFSWAQLGGLPEVRPNHPHDRLVTTGIRARVRRRHRRGDDPNGGRGVAATLWRTVSDVSPECGLGFSQIFVARAWLRGG